MMGQMFFQHLPFFMFESQGFVLFVALLAVAEVFGQAAKQAPLAPQRAIKLAQNGRCEEALPALKRASQPGADKTVRRTAAFAGVRCAMLINQTGAAVDFLQMLNREFPNDPEVLFLSVHTYSDLSTKAAQQLAMTAPNSIEGHKLDAEALEAQLIELSIVGKSFLCLYATWARRLYVIDVPGLPQIAGYNGMPPPRAMECGR